MSPTCVPQPLTLIHQSFELTVEVHSYVGYTIFNKY